MQLHVARRALQYTVKRGWEEGSFAPREVTELPNCRPAYVDAYLPIVYVRQCNLNYNAARNKHDKHSVESVK